MFKKSISVIVLLTSGIAAAMADSLSLNLNLSTDTPNNITAVPLDKLKTNTDYHISCAIENQHNEPVNVTVSPRLLANNYYNNIQINHKNSDANMGALETGYNEISFNVFLSTQDSHRYNQFSLETDTQWPITITECKAEPITTAKNALKPSAVTGSRNYFYAYNDTDHVVQIGVGNFFPTPYDIQPHSYRTVFVSTDNQSIHIYN